MKLDHGTNRQIYIIYFIFPVSMIIFLVVRNSLYALLRFCRLHVVSNAIEVQSLVIEFTVATFHMDFQTLTDFTYQRNQYNSNIVDISGALFKLCLTILILNSQCEVGARDINIIRVTVIICENNINFSVVIIWSIISFHLCKNQNEH